MIAIFKTGGKQYCVKAGQMLKVEKIEGKKGDIFTFNKILAVNDNSDNIIGNPFVDGVTIDAKIIDQIKSQKIIVFKKRRRKNYKLTQGHRQKLTLLKIESINKDGKKSKAKKAEKTDKIKKEIKLKENIKKTTKEKIAKKTKTKKKLVKKTVSKKKVNKK